ncbi:MAG: sensor histidine kinase [Roseburia sp.]
MKKRKLITQLSTGFACIALATIALISLASNLLINRQFERYVETQQKEFADRLAEGMANVYDMVTDTWNVGYIHGTGMYALNDGYIIKVYDKNGAVVWDAENHDMGSCHQIMDDIVVLMEERRPDFDGEFVTNRYDLSQMGASIGALEVSYYSPYYLNENAFQFLDALNRILAVISVAALLGSVISAYFLARRLSEPLSKTIHITKEISDGNYSIRFEAEPRTQELYELTQNINQMAESLEEQESLRKQMTTDVAHELKTPMAIVASHLEAIIEGVWEPTRERLQSCYDEIGHITQLVTDMQRLSQTESGSLKLNKEPVELKAFAEEIVPHFEGQLLEHQLACRVSGDASTVPVDRGRLQQVVSNLLSNAIKYTDDGKQIEIVVENRADGAVLTVADEGIGIPKEEQKKVFERFYRIDKSHSRKTGGAGIGLAIVKVIVQAHGGKVELESEKGKGSRFHVYLPKE